MVAFTPTTDAPLASRQLSRRDMWPRLAHAPRARHFITLVAQMPRHTAALLAEIEAEMASIRSGRATAAPLSDAQQHQFLSSPSLDGMTAPAEAAESMPDGGRSAGRRGERRFARRRRFCTRHMHVAASKGSTRASTPCRHSAQRGRDADVFLAKKRIDAGRSIGEWARAAYATPCY